MDEGPFRQSAPSAAYIIRRRCRISARSSYCRDVNQAMSRDEAFRKLTEILLGIESREEMTLFLSCILTRTETEDIIDRLRIYHQLIDQRVSQREAAQILGVSITKITRGAANLHNPEIRDYLRRKFGGMDTKSNA